MSFVLRMRSGCTWDALGMHLERVRHLTICRTMEFFLACLKSATKSFNVLLASKRPLITELSDKLRQKYLLQPSMSPYPTMRLETIRSMIRKYSSKRSELLRFNLYFCHVYRRILLFIFCNTKISEFFDMAKS